MEVRQSALELPPGAPLRLWPGSPKGGHRHRWLRAEPSTIPRNAQFTHQPHSHMVLRRGGPPEEGAENREVGRQQGSLREGWKELSQRQAGEDHPC